MALSIGIVGLPNVGKSTLFNALTKKGAEASNYPFCTIDPNVGVVKVPDERLQKLAEISKPKQIIPTVIEFVDIAGLVAGAHKGEGLGNQFLAHIRECDAICEVVRDFEDTNIIHVNGKIDAEGDKETINLELIFADLATAEKRLAKVVKEAKGGSKEAIKLQDVLQRIKINLEKGQAVRNMGLSEDEKFIIKDLSLLTAKPIIYILNINDKPALSSLGGSESAEVKWNGRVLKLNAQQEADIASLPDEEQAEYIKELGLPESGLDKLINLAYETLGLLTFFTTGPDETKAWTVKRDSKAPQAAGVIHTDFEKGFIRAEVINWQKFIEAGGETQAREKGFIRTEGKDYIMQDGDICNFLFN